jgi:hypothetical protein
MKELEILIEKFRQNANERIVLEKKLNDFIIEKYELSCEKLEYLQDFAIINDFIGTFYNNGHYDINEFINDVTNKIEEYNTDDNAWYFRLKHKNDDAINVWRELLLLANKK